MHENRFLLYSFHKKTVPIVIFDTLCTVKSIEPNLHNSHQEGRDKFTISSSAHVHITLIWVRAFPETSRIKTQISY
jgi:hypothetical protein